MKKAILFLASVTLGFTVLANVPTVSNQGFPLNVKTTSTEKVIKITKKSEQKKVVSYDNTKTTTPKVHKNLVKLNKEEKKEVKSAIKEFKKGKDAQVTNYTSSIPNNQTIVNAAQTDEVVLVLLSIVIPPLAVYLKSGIGNEFWIDLILTILGWVPGMIYALLLCLGII